MKIYTKTGDDGSTGLLGNVRVRKDTLRIATYGDVDELNASLGALRANGTLPSPANEWLEGIQSDLFYIGTLLATPPNSPKRYASLPDGRTGALELAIDRMEKDLPPLQNFILPFGTSASCAAHLSRAVCRRAERNIVALASQERVDTMVIPYINRLSDFLFVLARWLNHHDHGPECAWTADKGAIPAPKPDALMANLQKIEEDKKKRLTLFEKASADLERKKEQALRQFQKGVDQIRKEGGKIEKPFRDIDLD